jgi:Flp pilus assembly protein TadG
MEGWTVTDTKRARYGLRYTGSSRASDERGIAAVELALILPILLVLAFAVIDLGRFIQARMVIANMSREGGSLASRLEYDPTNKTALQTEFRRILDMLMSASSGLNMAADGKIYISRITAGTSTALPDRPVQEDTGSLVGAATSVTTPGAQFGLPTLYKYLDYGGVVPSTAVIGEVTVVEVFYKYTPITPIGKFIPGLLTGSGAIIASRAVF